MQNLVQILGLINHKSSTWISHTNHHTLSFSKTKTTSLKTKFHMENEMQIEAIPKKIWSVMRVFFFMLRKGVSKKKLSLHLSFILNRNKKREVRRREYEFSCSNTPAHHKFLFKKKQNKAHYEAQYETIEEEFMNVMGFNDTFLASSSPVLPGLLGFRPIRVTDSPFPVFSGRIAEGECHVNEAADEFIKKFYSQLRRQSLTDA